jgi:hypothetical protein
VVCVYRVVYTASEPWDGARVEAKPEAIATPRQWQGWRSQRRKGGAHKPPSQRRKGGARKGGAHNAARVALKFVKASSVCACVYPVVYAVHHVVIKP